jgi:hypothetical protein
VGGATRSKHLDGAAFDIAMANHDPVAFEAAAREVGFLGFGFYPRSGFMHIDLGPARQWGERFPVRETAFAAETPPAREVLADSRTMKGGGRGRCRDAGRGRRRGGAEVLPRPRPRSCRWCRISTRCAGCSSRWRSGHRGHDLRPPRRLAPGAAVIGGLIATLAGSAWARAALRYGVTALAILLFLLLLRWFGRLSSLKVLCGDACSKASHLDDARALRALLSRQ